MFKSIKNLFRRKEKPNANGTIEKFKKALYGGNEGITIVSEELTEYEIGGHLYHLGDKVICRSNECDPLLIGEIVEFWDNKGKWSNCIPQIKDSNGNVWGVMGLIKPYSDELLSELQPLRPLEQYNHLLDDDVKELYSYSEEEIIRKEKFYKHVQKNKEKNNINI